MTNSNAKTARYMQTLIAGLWRENPVFRLLLGMCPTLAVTAAVKPALTMGCCVIFVLICSNIIVSLIKDKAPKWLTESIGTIPENYAHLKEFVSSFLGISYTHDHKTASSIADDWIQHGDIVV